jgi:hypothetical protein
MLISGLFSSVSPGQLIRKVLELEKKIDRMNVQLRYRRQPVSDRVSQVLEMEVAYHRFSTVRSLYDRALNSFENSLRSFMGDNWFFQASSSFYHVVLFVRRLNLEDCTDLKFGRRIFQVFSPKRSRNLYIELNNKTDWFLIVFVLFSAWGMCSMFVWQDSSSSYVVQNSLWGKPTFKKKQS